MIIKITHLAEIATDDIIQALASNYNEIILGAKMRFTRLGRSHLEIIFKSYTELCHYITSGISLMGQTHSRYYASSGNKNYLNITIKNVSILELLTITKAIKKFFKNICPISAIKLLVYADTKFLSD